MFGPEVEGAHGTFLQFAMDKLRQKGQQFDAFSDQKLALKKEFPVNPDVHHKFIRQAVSRIVLGWIHPCSSCLKVGCHDVI